MIIIIHGEDVKSSREYFLSEKQKVENSMTFDGQTLTLTDLVQAIEGGSLFENDVTLFVENFLSKRKERKDEQKIIDYLQKASGKKIYLWEGKELTKTALAPFKNADVKVFKYPQTLFSFLDSIGIDSKKSIVLFHETLKNTEVEILFFMLIRQMRMLLALQDGGSQIEEVKRLAPWQKIKLAKQAKLFSKERLIEIFKKLYDIDYALKTGKSGLSTVQAIDFFFLEI